MSNSFNIETITPDNYKEASVSVETINDFLHTHLDRFRDSKNEIQNCLDYALSITPHRKGFIMVALDKEAEGGDHLSSDGKRVLGILVMCETGMSGFVPDNLLVYIAVDAETRGRGIGKSLMESAIETADGDVALHVEPDNPAKRLYERIGFTNKYLEMRLKK